MSRPRPIRLGIVGATGQVGDALRRILAERDFPLESISAELGRRLEVRINYEIAAAREVLVSFLGRDAADADPALIRTAANLIPREIDPLRVIDIVGLDKQADGGTHVASTAEVGGVRVVGTGSKGKGNKRVRIELSQA